MTPGTCGLPTSSVKATGLGCNDYFCSTGKQNDPIPVGLADFFVVGGKAGNPEGLQSDQVATAVVGSWIMI